MVGLDGATSDIAVVWFRDDLRLADNEALTAAVHSGKAVLALYVLDDGAHHRSLGGASRWWLHHSLESLGRDLAALGVPLVLRRGHPEAVVPEVVIEAGADEVHWNRRYDQRARDIDTALKADLSGRSLLVKSHSGHLLVEPWTVKTRGGDWFKVFTPFWKAASTTLDDLAPALPVPTGVRGASKSVRSDDLDSYGLKPSNPDWAGSFRTTWMPGEAGARARLAGFLDRRLNRYAAERDYPGADATSNLSPHLRFGEISVRTVWHAAGHYSAAHGVREAALNKFRSELGWREFSYHLLFHFPDLGWRNFQGRFDGFPWDDANPLVRAWQLGQTGYPIVDAGMRQLWATGTIHNRVRMVVGSFLVKHLLVHWTVGENWFWDTLCDADVANNAAGWQWVAGSGADAAPFFRVFNPVLQGEKFDPDGSYVRTWVPELAKMPSEFLHKPWLAPDVILRNSGVHLGRSYPEPIVDHQKARDRALAAFERIKAAA